MMSLHRANRYILCFLVMASPNRRWGGKQEIKSFVLKSSKTSWKASGKDMNKIHRNTQEHRQV